MLIRSIRVSSSIYKFYEFLRVRVEGGGEILQHQVVDLVLLFCFCFFVVVAVTQCIETAVSVVD